VIPFFRLAGWTPWCGLPHPVLIVFAGILSAALIAAFWVVSLRGRRVEKH